MIQKSWHLLEHVPNRQTAEGVPLRKRHAIVERGEGVRGGFPVVTVADRLPMAISLVFPKAGALCERLQALSVSVQVHLLGRRALGVLLQEAGAVWPVYLVFWARRWWLSHANCALPT